MVHLQQKNRIRRKAGFHIPQKQGALQPILYEVAKTFQEFLALTSHSQASEHHLYKDHRSTYRSPAHHLALPLL